MTIPIRQNTAQIITVGPFVDKTDGVTPELSLTVTGCHITMTADTADGNAPTLVIDVDATASGGDNDLVHITNDNAGYYSLELTAAQTNRVGGGRLCINDDDVHCPVFHELEFLPANVYDSRFGTDKLQVDAVEVSGDSTAADNLESACDNYSATRGLAGTALPAAAADAAGGLPISDAGGLDLDTYIKRIEASITATILARIDENISAAKTLAASQPNYAPAKAGDAMTLTSAYDAAKTAAQAGDKMDIVDAPSATGKNALADAFLTRDFSLVSYTGTVKCILTSMQKLRNTVQAVTGKLKIYKENGTDLSWEQNITEDSDANPVTKLES